MIGNPQLDGKELIKFDEECVNTLTLISTSVLLRMSVFNNSE